MSPSPTVTQSASYLKVGVLLTPFSLRQLDSRDPRGMLRCRALLLSATFYTQLAAHDARKQTNESQGPFIGSMPGQRIDKPSRSLENHNPLVTTLICNHRRRHMTVVGARALTLWVETTRGSAHRRAPMDGLDVGFSLQLKALGQPCRRRANGFVRPPPSVGWQAAPRHR
jgi:hypothetical protein